MTISRARPPFLAHSPRRVEAQPNAPRGRAAEELGAAARVRGSHRTQAMIAPQPQAPPAPAVNVEAAPLEWEVPQVAVETVESLLDPALAVVQAAPEVAQDAASAVGAVISLDGTASEVTLPANPHERAEAILRLGVKFNWEKEHNAYQDGVYTGGPLDNWQFIGVVHPELDGPVAGRPELTWQVAQLGGGKNAFLVSAARPGDVVAVDYPNDGDSKVDFLGISDGNGSVIYSSAKYDGVVKKTVGELRGEGYSVWALPAPGRTAPPGTLLSQQVTVGERVVLRARQLLGTPYDYGSMYRLEPYEDNQLQCAEFTREAWQPHANLTRSVYDQRAMIRTHGVPFAQRQPGDIIVYAGRDVDHVAIYAGNDRVLHASSYYGRAVETSMYIGLPIVGVVRPAS